MRTAVGRRAAYTRRLTDREGVAAGDRPTESLPGRRTADGELGLDASTELDASEETISLDQLSLLGADDVTLKEVAEQTTFGEILLEDLIRRQLMLSLTVAALFLAILLGLPLADLLFPRLVATPLFGLPLGWLVLAVLVYPLLWMLAAYFVSTAKKYEDDFTGLVK